MKKTMLFVCVENAGRSQMAEGFFRKYAPAECPVLFLNNPVDWGIKDLKGKNIERVRIIHDEIERRVIELVKDLEHK